MGIRPKTMPKSKGSIMKFLLIEMNDHYPMVLEKVVSILEEKKSCLSPSGCWVGYHSPGFVKFLFKKINIMRKIPLELLP